MGLEKGSLCPPSPSHSASLPVPISFFLLLLLLLFLVPLLNSQYLDTKEDGQLPARDGIGDDDEEEKQEQMLTTEEEAEHIPSRAMEEEEEGMHQQEQGWHRSVLDGVPTLAFTLPLSGVKTKTMPCCAESIGQHVCNELRNRRPVVFRKRCKTDADFAILQCCFSCRTNVAELGRELFADGLKSRHCFDRHNRHFCSHFVHQSGMWAANAGKAVNCNGESAALAFRVCRRSCGFCEPGLYQRPNRNCSTTRTSAIRVKSNGTTARTTLDGGRWKNKDKGPDKTPNVTTTTTATTTASSTSSASPSTSTDAPLTATTTVLINSTSSPSSSSAAVPSPPPVSTPALTLSPTRLPPTTPHLRPCTLPPLPRLPTIPPCPPPIAPLKPLTEATIAPPPMPKPTLRPKKGPKTAPHGPPPKPPHPSFPSIPPIGPSTGGRRPLPPASITITWRPAPGGGTWPDWPIPLPDEVIEAILNKLTGIDSSGIRVGKCEDCGRAKDEERKEKSVVSEESAEGQKSEEPVEKTAGTKEEEGDEEEEQKEVGTETDQQ